MKLDSRKLGIVGVLVALVALLAWVALRAGPLAAVPVTLATVEKAALTPTLFGVGLVEARYTHKVGPTFSGRIMTVLVQPGERVTLGQLLAEMDPVDFNERISAQLAGLKRAEANALAAEAQIREVSARKAFADSQIKRYEELLKSKMVSSEAAEAKRQEARIAQASLAAARAGLEAARHELTRLAAEGEGLARQRENLRFFSPVNGLVTRRLADPGTTLVAGQAIVEVVEPDSLWVNARFDQQRAIGLAAGLDAQIVLRSHPELSLAAKVVRIEPHADPVTEETLAKVDFAALPSLPPPIGELAEITVTLPATKAMPIVPNASIQRIEGRLGVWLVDAEGLRFAPVRAGVGDLEGRVQIVDGLKGGERVVVYSRKALDADTRIKVVEKL